jgi:hypothetical protein
MKHNVSHDAGLAPQCSSAKPTLRRALARHWPLLWLVTAALALGVCGSLAAYTNYTSKKSVVSTQVPSDLQFSSNYMSAYLLPTDPAGVDCDTRPLTVGAASPTVTVSVCNYDQATADTPNASPITYTLEAVLVDNSGVPLTGASLAEAGEKFSLELLGSATDSNSSNETWYFASGSVTVRDQVLTGGTLASNLYRIHLDADLLDSVSIKIYAYPQDTASCAATGNFMLARILEFSVASNQTDTQWKISCTDSANAPAQLDGFNYALSGQLSGTLTLTWQTEHVAISPLSLTALGANSSIDDLDARTASVTFAVSADTPLYLLQFYRTSPAAENESWENVNGYVQVSFASGDSTGDTTGDSISNSEQSPASGSTGA